MKRPHIEQAHTLIETLIALALAAFVMAAAVSLYRAQRSTHGASLDGIRARDAASTALALIAQSVRMAGFVPLDASAGTAVVPVFGCTSGRPSGDSARPGCAAATADSDGLQARYIGDAVSTWPTASGQATDCLGQGVGAPAARPLIVNRYFVRNRGGSSEPELYCEGSGRPGVAQPLVDGIERLRMRYRMRNDVAWRDAAAIAGSAWASVVAVEICVEARGAAASGARRYVDCDGRVRAVRDGRGRRIARQWLSLRNGMAAAGETR
ncbi:PilW family protein [Burkholderia sp. Ac-20379]|uniref:PilW family protein n=1 Tax=Burkholderia sp. Ac-20379 TaxID=2703900 RepID=UPI00197D1691|nr:PilW family protein [Burkholderia sp. Ac-20379]MBN3724667.1 type IV pillus assembly protein [Burkholderia sp. Ac-20379]